MVGWSEVGLPPPSLHTLYILLTQQALCDTAVIELMHHIKPNITDLFLCDEILISFLVFLSDCPVEM